MVSGYDAADYGVLAHDVLDDHLIPASFVVEVAVVELGLSGTASGGLGNGE